MSALAGGGGFFALELMWWLCRDKRVHCTWIYTHVGITNCPRISKHDETRLCFILFPDHGAISYKTNNMFLACQCWKLEVGENANIYDRFCVHVWRGPEHFFLETKNCVNSIVSFTLHSTQKYGKYQGYWLLEVQLCFKTHLVLAHPTPHMIAESGKSLIHIVNYHEILNISK